MKTTIDQGFEAFSPYRSKCAECKHFDKINFNCVAFPEVIPERFLSGSEVHDKVTKDQTGDAVFTPES